MLRWSGRDRGLTSRLDLDLARLCLLRHWNAQFQHAGVVGRLDVVEVEGVAEDELATEHATRTLRRDQLIGRLPCRPVSSNRQHVALDVELDRVTINARKVELHVEDFPIAPGAR